MRQKLRTLLVLGRVSNLPTVWSNCLAAWLLSAAAPNERLGFPIIGTSLLYVGGMYLNDAFDADFDAKFRRERPIPSGRISRQTVSRLGWAWLGLGCAFLFFAGNIAGFVGLALGVCIVIYNSFHKRMSFAPVVMGLCRFFVYLVAGACATNEITTSVILGGVAVCLYIVGLAYIARRESTGGALSFWPLAPLLGPIVIALCRSDSAYRERAMLLCLVPLLWMIKSLRYAFAQERDVGRAVSGLLAGIVLVDWLAVANSPREIGVVFILLFVLSLGLQKWVPAT